MIFRDELRQTESMELQLAGVSRTVVSVVPSSVIGHEILLYGIYEKDVVKRLLGALKPGDLCLDIGANFGTIQLVGISKGRP